jgi:hypothetical protein
MKTAGLVEEQLVESLRFKPEGREFDSRYCNYNLSFTYPSRPHYDNRVDSESNRNEYQVYFLGYKSGHCPRLTTLMH